MAACIANTLVPLVGSVLALLLVMHLTSNRGGGGESDPGRAANIFDFAPTTPLRETSVELASIASPPGKSR